MRNRIIVACFVLAGIVGLGAHSSTAALASSNSRAAHACQHGGYALLLGTDGKVDVSFANSGGCASYASGGGLLVPIFVALPCLSNGYQGLTSTGGSAAFTNEAACVLYVGQGGALVPFSAVPALSASISGPSSSFPGDCNMVVNGSGLLPGTYIMVNVQGGESFTLLGPDGSTPVTVPANGAVNFSTFVVPGFTVTVSGTDSTGASITSSSFDITC